MLMFVGTEADWEKFSPEERKQAYEQIGTWWGEHSAAGRIVDGEELQATRTAVTVRRRSDGRVIVTDGPFVESKETLGGYAVVDVPDLDAAIELAKGWPPLQTIEIRPFVEHRNPGGQGKYMLMFVSGENGATPPSPDEMKRVQDATAKWWEPQRAAGRVVSEGKLHGADAATTIKRQRDGRITVTDGPFIETKEHVGGYAILDVDRDTAIEIARTCPVLEAMEVRPVVVQRD
jgi:hypothetical protein